MNIFLDYKEERKRDVAKIKESDHPRKVVVAGPGTGKSFLFTELIDKKKAEGKTNFLAITYIGKLTDSLADDLCGLAETMTMHSFARKFVLGECGTGWVYYPDIFEIIREDLVQEGITDFKIGDDNYKEKTLHYKAVGDADVIHYALQICKKDEGKIPTFDLILIDEFQDFNENESAFVDELAKKNQIVIVGDDDQALYEFKGSSPAFIRKKHHESNTDWESHTLRFCSRCTQVIIKYFHTLVDKYQLKNITETDPEKRRVEKDYICYCPETERDSKIYDSRANEKIHLIKNCPVGMIAYKVQTELEKIIKTQKIKEVLIIGEAKSCKTLLQDTARMLTDYGFKNVNSKETDLIKLDYRTLDAYGLIDKSANSTLGWRLLGSPNGQVKDEHIKKVKTLHKILEKEKVADSSVVELLAQIDKTTETDEEIKRSLILRDIKQHFKSLPRPLANLDITVCNILNSKGLGADIVFVIGFDQGRLPKTTTPAPSEVYQMLVAITRAKKRIYLINTVGRQVSQFLSDIEVTELEVHNIPN